MVKGTSHIPYYYEFVIILAGFGGLANWFHIVPSVLKYE